MICELATPAAVVSPHPPHQHQLRQWAALFVPKFINLTVWAQGSILGSHDHDFGRTSKSASIITLDEYCL